jgi:hypothetical protein
MLNVKNIRSIFKSDLWIMKFLETARMCVSLSDKYFGLKMCCVVLEEFNINIGQTFVDLLHPDAERSFTLYLIHVLPSVSLVLFCFLLITGRVLH